MNGSPTLQRMLQDPTVQREMSSRTQNVEVLIQQVILNEQSQGRVDDLSRSEQRYRDSAINQHELLVRAEASAQCREGQLDQARRCIFQDGIILSHVRESEYLACAEAYHQYMNAELSAQGFSHVRGIAEDWPMRLQRIEAGAGAQVTGLEQYAVRRYAEECEFSQRRLREVELDRASQAHHFQTHEAAAREEVATLGRIWPHIMASERSLEEEDHGMWRDRQAKDQEIRALKSDIRSQAASADSVAPQGLSRIREAQEDVRAAEDPSRGVVTGFRPRSRRSKCVTLPSKPRLPSLTA